MKNKSAFTIVELLVVIVVIGILASITILSYNGITNKAIASSLQSDLANASKQLDLFQVDYGYYPSTIDCTIPDSVTNKCIKTNPANSFTYLPGLGTNPTTYTLTATHTSTNANYTITPNSPPIATAPENPVADWLAMPRGDHYGNFYDLVSKQYATVTRSTPKTIYDPTTNRIYDVPPNTLGIRPRSDGKAGYEAEVEESRTNYVKNSSFETDTNLNGVADYWNPQNTTITSPTYSISTNSLHSSKSQLIDYSGQVGEASKSIDFYQTSSSGAFVSGESATFSIFHKGSLQGTTFRLQIQARDSSHATVGSMQLSNILTSSNWSKSSVTYSNLPANTNYLLAVFWIESIDQGDSVQLYVDSAQLEKGAFGTSFIPTSSTADVIRNMDMVTVPTTGLNYNQGTLIGLAQKPTVSGALIGIPGTSSNINRIQLTNNGASSQSSVWFFGSDGNIIAPLQSGSLSGYNMIGGSWENDSVKSSVNGVNGASLATDAMNGLHTAMYLGSYGTLYHHNTPIQRFITYSTVLSDSEMSNLYDNIKDGP